MRSWNGFLSWMFPWVGGMLTMYAIEHSIYLLLIIPALIIPVVDGIFVNREFK